VLSFLSNDSILNNYYPIAVDDGGKPMGDDNNGSVFLGKQPVDSLLDVELTLCIERRSGFIEYQNLGIFYDAASFVNICLYQ
jgi:hypothetical protein